MDRRQTLLALAAAATAVAVQLAPSLLASKACPASPTAATL